MKRNLILLLAAFCLPFVLHAQNDDDMYFVPSKKKASSSAQVSRPSTSSRNTYSVPEENYEPAADYHTGNLRNVDDYNRRGAGKTPGGVSARIVNDTLYVTTDSATVETYPLDEQSLNYGEDNYYDDDYYYSNRLRRYHGSYLYDDPWYWDIAWGWYDPWYDPWYGFYGPYYRAGWWSWYDWGWYPGWSWGWGYGGWGYAGWGCGWYYPHYHIVGPGHPGREHFGNHEAIHTGGRRTTSTGAGWASRGGARGGRLGDGIGRTSSTRTGRSSVSAGRSATSNFSGRSTGTRGGRTTTGSRSSSSSSYSAPSRSSSYSSPSSGFSGGRSSSSSGFSGGGRSSGGGFSGGGGGRSGGGGGGGRGGR